MKHKWISSFTGLLLISLLSLFAEIDQPLYSGDLESYIRRALEANPQLEAFEARYEAALQRVTQTSALPDPMLQVTHFVESVQTRTGPQENVFMFSQKLPWLGKLGKREEAASAEAEALWFAYQDQQLTLAREVAVAFYEYGYIQEAIRLAGENRDLLAKLEPIVEEKVKAGADLNALLRLKVEIGKVEDRLQTLQQKRIAQSAKLAKLLAMPNSENMPAPEWAPNAPGNAFPHASVIFEAIQEHNPSLQMLKRKVASAQARGELARLERFPDITLGLNYMQVGDPVVNPTTPDAGKDAWGVTVGVNIPLWFHKNKAARSEALANRRAAEREYEDRSNALRAQLSIALSVLRDAQRRLVLYGEQLLELAEQAVANSRTSYQSGRTGILEVIDSERSLLDLQLLYWRAAADAKQQRVTIQTLASQSIF